MQTKRNRHSLIIAPRSRASQRRQGFRGGGLMRQGCGYSKADFSPSPSPGGSDGCPPQSADREEIVVGKTVGRYIARCDSAIRASARRCRSPRPHYRQMLPLRWVAGAGQFDRRNPMPSVPIAAATPTTEFCDAMTTDALGCCRPSSPHPNSAAPLAAAAAKRAAVAAAAARPGVPPECQSACLSMPPTPKKLGWW